MHERDAFATLVQRVRDGDAEAADELIRLYEPEIRRFIRYRLSSASLSALLESLDIWQSVLARFFVQLDTGHLDLEEPTQLRKLLITMARNKVYDQIRRQTADRRDRRKHCADGGGRLDELACGAETPSQIVARREILALVRASLSEEETYLLEQRVEGRPWDALAEELQARPDALRKRLTRAMDRVAGQWGISQELK
ncbi:RNA polymerase sigma factor [Roseimaritima sediminicola]|uniref:RNA polymerase sigma factor n=1 Tax=Roseimaritima sediminicola TaxID=2662066 RepID=UPI001386A136|nr:ECF-type sigma factor [Roseimaritima sediminicola]